MFNVSETDAGLETLVPIERVNTNVSRKKRPPPPVFPMINCSSVQRVVGSPAIFQRAVTANAVLLIALVNIHKRIIQKWVHPPELVKQKGEHCLTPTGTSIFSVKSTPNQNL